jgi:YbbR domain-containing protein
MPLKTRAVILHPNSTKCAALILGYSIWFFASSYQWVAKDFSVPVCFYQDETMQRQIQAPETVRIKITGPRRYMHYVNPASLALNIDATKLNDGTHEIFLHETNLFLPEPLKLVELDPSVISCSIQQVPKTADA